MDEIIRSRLTVTCWKERSCCYCGFEFGRRLTATRTGTGQTREEADADAVQAVMATVERMVDMTPCQHCGKYQPEMVGSARFTHLLVAAVVSAAWFVPVVFEYQGVFPRWLAIAALVAFGMAVVLAHLWIVTGQPNFFARRNRKRVAHMIQHNFVRVKLGSGKPTSEWQSPVSLRLGCVFWFLFFGTIAS